MNDQAAIFKQSPGQDPKLKRNSGLFSFLRWFRTTSRESVSSDVAASSSSESLNSTGTAASFSFISPTAYTKSKDKCIVPGPETDTYKARLKQRDKIRERDKDVTLRKKYNLFFHRDTLNSKRNEEEHSRSLPMTRKMEEERGHRRTNSDSSKTKRAGAYLHVKGKRKAPQPPNNRATPPEGTLSLRRNKKRLAPPPPVVTTDKVINTLQQTTSVISNDSLKLDNGVLKPAKQVETKSQSKATPGGTPVSPRPWYKRNNSKNDSPKKEEKRKSGLMFLTNISELDREATELITKQNNPLPEMPEFMRPKPEADDTLTPKRRSAKDLIAKFNAITNVTKVTVNSAFFGQRENVAFQKRDYFGRSPKEKQQPAPLMKSETTSSIAAPKIDKKPWKCPKCNLENDYWRIICHVCSTIKPYFDDLAITQPTQQRLPAPLERSKTQIGFTEKKNEREQLKKMLIDMKNSLPKRKPHSAQQTRKSTIEENEEENLNKSDTKLEQIEQNNVKKEEEVKLIKPVKISTAAQTPAKKPEKNFQLMRPKDFEDIYSEKSGKPTGHLYANLAQNENLFFNVPKRFSDIKNNNNNHADTLEINRLLRRLENAIAKGDMSDAAIFAKELAQLKVNCSVIRQKTPEKIQPGNKNGYMVEMYVEDRLSHRGPFPIQVTATQSVAELKQQVEKEFEIPIGVQRWILGKELASDDNATLQDLKVTTNGCPVFLYLVAPSSKPKEEKEINVPSTSGEPKKVEEKTQVPKIVGEQFKVQVTKIAASSSKQPPIAVEEDFSEYDKTMRPHKKTWECKYCTLLNPNSTNVCLVCSLVRMKESPSAKRKVVKSEPKHYLELMKLDSSDLVSNTEAFECLVCLTEIKAKQGVTLRECLHQFCKPCLAHTIEFSEEAEVKCPYRDQQYSCDIALQDREIKALVTPGVYDQFLAKSVSQAENKMDKSFHCKTPDCKGWCVFEDNVNDFKCPVCRKTNCLTCQAIHTGLNCKQYQEHMNAKSETDEDARRTREMLEEMVNKGEALTCPACQVILMKKWGCDWVRCSMCKTEICWVTRGLRWGPGGKGDTNGGCRCGVNGVKCHPQCNYCH